MIFSGYTANNYPRSTTALVVFGGKFNASWTSQTAKRMVSLQSFFLLLIRQYPVDLAIQNFILRRMRRRRLRVRFLQSLQMLYLFYRNRRLQVARRPRRAWIFPRPQNWFQELLNNRALDHWWKENFRVSRATFEYICRLVGPAIVRQNTRMRDAVPVEKRVTVSMWRLATGECYRSCGLMIGLAKPTGLSAVMSL